MQQFTAARSADTPDEVWLLEHNAVYTQGQAGKSEHVVQVGNTPIIQTDRGGQVTWHGTGQLMFYTLLDVRRLHLGARALVSILENTLIHWLGAHGVQAFSRTDAPGVYLRDADNQSTKIAALGLRIRQQGCYHGMALNIDCDLASFAGIHPCGMAGQRVTHLAQWLSPLPSRAMIEAEWVNAFVSAIGYTDIQHQYDA